MVIMVTHLSATRQVVWPFSADNEPIGRYRILRNEYLHSNNRALQSNALSINPDNIWTLVWSSDNAKAAKKVLQKERHSAASWQTYQMIDAARPDDVIDIDSGIHYIAREG